MADGIRLQSGADIGISTTGYAGPTGAPGLIGQVFIAVSTEEGCNAYEVNLKGNRERVRDGAVLNALNLLRKQIIAKTGAIWILTCYNNLNKKQIML